jgi:SAM-dependent methyltransferase
MLSRDAAPAMTALSERTVCTFCGGHVDPRVVENAAVPSNVRAFKHEVFHVWRCPDCRSLHCLEIVDLARYYVDYPIPRRLSPIVRFLLDNQIGRIIAHGAARSSRILDYGCGYGLLLERLQERGFTDVTGYDPYASNPAFRDPAGLRSQFDFIVLQDVIEHVEDPRALLSELDHALRPGGAILIGTPDAGGISLADVRKYWMQLHPPYHLHIYTGAALEALGRERGWAVERVFDRPYYDTTKPGLNARAADKYKWFHDGTLDAIQEPVAPERLLRSIRFMFLYYFGYWFKRGGEVAVVFRKQGGMQ